MDWNALLAPLMAAAGYALKMIVDLLKARYQAAKEQKAQQESTEDRLRVLVYEWREHAYIVRKLAIDAGVREADLPEKPNESDAR